MPLIVCAAKNCFFHGITHTSQVLVAYFRVIFGFLLVKQETVDTH